MNKLSSAFFLLSFFLSLSYGQNKPVTFDRFTTKDGLSQNRIFDIIQDDLGFIWIGTEDGLNRYDGYTFKIFKNIPGDSTSLIQNQIETLYMSRKGELWFGGPRTGLIKFIAENETFKTYRNNHSDHNTISGDYVKDISEDTKGNLWIATSINGFDYF